MEVALTVISVLFCAFVSLSVTKSLVDSVVNNKKFSYYIVLIWLTASYFSVLIDVMAKLFKYLFG